MRISPFAISLALHAAAFGAIATFRAPTPTATEPADIAVALGPDRPQLAPEDDVAPPEFESPSLEGSAFPDDRSFAEDTAFPAETVELDDPWADPPPEAAADASRAIAVASPFGTKNVRFGPSRTRPGTPGGTGTRCVSVIATAALPPLPPPPPPPPVVRHEVERTPAKVLRAVAPDYPERALDRGIEGRVALVVEILEDGAVGDIHVVASSGSDLLDDAARDCVRSRWRFEPARADGVAVRSSARLPAIHFRIER